MALAAILAAALAGCAGASDEAADNDPAEPVNRAVFAANMAVDHAVVKPIAESYRDYVPADLRRGIHNVASNLHEPVVATNDLLQGNTSRAWTSAERFGINSTAGYAGVVDRAAERNLPPHSADFGQTLAVWGVGEGPFVELPALGPSTLRDAIGTAAGMILYPLSVSGVPALGYVGYARTGAEFIGARTDHLDDRAALEGSSMDLYATLRSIYRQHRQAEIDQARGTPAPGG